MPKIVLVRHGETHWNREKRVQGHADSPLTLKGIEQARAYGAAIARLTEGGQGWRVVSSPLPRCIQTSAILCEAMGVAFTRVERDERLREVSTGAYSGLLKAEMSPELLTGSGTNSWFFRCPNGETHAQVQERLKSWLAEREKGDKIICVSHGVAGRVLRGLYAGLDPNEAMNGDSPQDAVFLLQHGRLERVAC